MFTNGRIIFVSIFAVVFVIALVFSYRKDASKRRKYYKNSFWILLGFIGFLGFVILMKAIFKSI